MLRLLLITYLVGGVTFVPLVIAYLLFAGYLEWPDLDGKSDGGEQDANGELKNRAIFGNTRPAQTSTDSLPTSPVAEGFFAVTRTFVTGGVCSKPAAPAPGQNPGPESSLDYNGRKVPGNVFYVELR